MFSFRRKIVFIIAPFSVSLHYFRGKSNFISSKFFYETRQKMLTYIILLYVYLFVLFVIKRIMNNFCINSY